MNQKGFISLWLIGALVIALSIGGYFVLSKKSKTPLITSEVQGIVIEEPTANQEVKLPITVKGYINGNGWTAFEGVAGSVQVYDANNKVISDRQPLQAVGDWMQTVVHFETMVGDRQVMSNLDTQTGYLLLRSEEEKDESNVKEFRVPIRFTNNQTPVSTPVVCSATEHSCPCATGNYCLFRGAMCLNPASACPNTK